MYDGLGVRVIGFGGSGSKGGPSGPALGKIIGIPEGFGGDGDGVGGGVVGAGVGFAVVGKGVGKGVFLGVATGVAGGLPEAVGVGDAKSQGDSWAELTLTHAFPTLHIFGYAPPLGPTETYAYQFPLVSGESVKTDRLVPYPVAPVGGGAGKFKATCPAVLLALLPLAFGA